MSVRRFARVLAAPRVLAALCVLALSAFVQPARAELSVAIDKSRQQMTVALNGERLFVWPVSTGAHGYDTPSGAFTPFRMEKDHFSKEWDDAPMPHSMFFTMKGHAIHGSTHLKAMGTPASHGCVRLEPRNAKILFDLVKQEGMNKTRVSITGETPNGAPQVARRNVPAPVVAAPVNSGYARSYGNDRSYDTNDRFYGNNDDPVVGALPPPPPRGERLVREYRDGRTYYYRVAPRRYGYADPYEPSPYPFFGR